MSEDIKSPRLKYVPHKIEYIRQRLNLLLERKIINQNDLEKLFLAPAPNRKTILKRLSERTQWADNLNESDFHSIVECLHQRDELHPRLQRNRVREIEDHLFFSLSLALDTRPATEQDMKDLVPGHYVAYRPSVYVPDSVVVSVFIVKVLPTGAVATKEIQYFRESGIQPVKRQIYTGYLVRRHRRFLCFDTDSSSQFARVSILSESFSDHEKILGLTGVSTGVIGSKTYSTRVHMERVNISKWSELKTIVESLNVYNRSRIPASILGAIDPKDHSNIHIF